VFVGLWVFKMIGARQAIEEFKAQQLILGATTPPSPKQNYGFRNY
jgi:hypothetical protein